MQREKFEITGGDGLIGALKRSKREFVELITTRQKAWIGDAVLSLYARQWILREKGKMDGELHTRFTANDFLATIGNPSGLEAALGVVYETEGLEAAFAWIEREILPPFLAPSCESPGISDQASPWATSRRSASSL